MSFNRLRRLLREGLMAAEEEALLTAGELHPSGLWSPFTTSNAPDNAFGQTTDAAHVDTVNTAVPVLETMLEQFSELAASAEERKKAAAADAILNGQEIFSRFLPPNVKVYEKDGRRYMVVPSADDPREMSVIDMTPPPLPIGWDRPIEIVPEPELPPRFMPVYAATQFYVPARVSIRTVAMMPSTIDITEEKRRAEKWLWRWERKRAHMIERCTRRSKKKRRM